MQYNISGKRVGSRAVHLAVIACCLAASILILKYALAWVAPFIAAIIIARFTEPIAALLQRVPRLPRAAASGIAVAFVFSVIIAVFAFIAARIITELTVFARALPAHAARVTDWIAGLSERADAMLAGSSPEIKVYIESAINGLTGAVKALPSKASSSILSGLSSAAQAAPRTILFILTTMVATFFVSAGKGEFAAFTAKQIPRKYKLLADEIKAAMQGAVGGYLKAELMLSAVTYAELSILFLVLRIDFAMLIALLVTLIDLLPMIGIGAVMLPWSIFSFASNDFFKAILLLAGFVLMIVVRNILEPRLLGRRLGIQPLAALAAMYIGFRAAGVPGMIFLPVFILVIKRLNDKGVVNVWR